MNDPIMNQKILDSLDELRDYRFQQALWNTTSPAELIYLPEEAIENLFTDSGLARLLEIGHVVFNAEIDNQLNELAGITQMALAENDQESLVDSEEMGAVRNLAGQIFRQLKHIGLKDRSEMFVDGLRAEIEGDVDRAFSTSPPDDIPFSPLPRLMRFYESLRPEQRDAANTTLAEWALSSNAVCRYEALSLISIFNIASARPALEELLLVLSSVDGSSEYTRRSRVESVLHGLR